MVPTYTAQTLARTEFIRTPVEGPKPYNTLAFVRCKGWWQGFDSFGFTDLVRFNNRFTTTFRIDGFTQTNRLWYQENTHVSATAFIQVLNLTSDMSFVFGIDIVQPFIDDDGKLGFECQLAMQVDSPGFFEREVDLTFSYTVSAYVLLYEPRLEPLPPGTPGKRLSLDAIPPQFQIRNKKLHIVDDPSLKFKTPK